MDHIVFERAPLLELIVQLQWQVESLEIPGAPQIVATSNSSSFDRWFHNLTSHLEKQGYTELKRLVRADMPQFAHQAIFRYQQKNKEFPVIQFGHGVFTVNAGPPSYKSWQDFHSTVESSIKVFLNSVPSDVSLNEFTNVNMRYIDVFDKYLREGKSNYEFISEDLGISLKFPVNLSDYVADAGSISPTFALEIPLKQDPTRKLRFSILSGYTQKMPSTLQTIMELNCTVNASIESTPQRVLSILNDLHEILHKWFMDITSKIQSRMSSK